MAHDIIQLTATEQAAAIQRGELSSVEVTQAHLDHIADTDAQINAFIHVAADDALAQAAAVDKARAAGQTSPSPLTGVPIALKDLVTQRGIPTTGASKILAGWVPPFEATITTKLRQAGLVILGKTNLDEFAMGASTETSAAGPTHNPWDTSRIPGGSGGGSAAALAAFQAPLAIGTDTGGSIRQPAALTGTVGVKPTYGQVSRHGIIAMASSLDQGGPAARTVLDAAHLHEVIAGYDPHDGLSLNGPIPAVAQAVRRGQANGLTGLRIGVVRELGGESYQQGVTASFTAAIAMLEAAGADLVEVSCPHFDYAPSAYYLIMASEVSSNSARFDAMRYGLRVGDDGTRSAEAVMAATRSAGFGAEVQRRILIGMHALSAQHYHDLYESAAKARTLIIDDFARAFEQVDVLISPTSPVTAPEIGHSADDPVASYQMDLATNPASLAGIPAMSVPSGLAADSNLPVGLQIMAPALGETVMYRVAGAFEAAWLVAHDAPLLSSSIASSLEG